MEEAQMIELLAKVMEQTERPHTAVAIRIGGEVSNIGQGTTLIAMRLAYERGLYDGHNGVPPVVAAKL